MARPKSIPWRERVSIFADYRRSRKVQPTAKRHSVARSTVTAIVNEFAAEGFSTSPRPSLPEDVLREMQERHLGAVLEGLRGASGEVSAPYNAVSLDLGPTTRGEVEQQRDTAPSLSVGQEIAWHLKETEAERALSVITTAAADYRQRLRRVWDDLRRDLEAACDMPELEHLPSVRDMEREPRILPELRDAFHRALFEPEFKYRAPGEQWLEWDVQPEVPTALRLRKQRVAVGFPSHHEKVRQGVGRLIAEKFKEYQRRFVDLDNLRRDLYLMDEVTRERRAAVNADDIRSSVCPACPYPEATAWGAGMDKFAKKGAN